MNINAGPIAYWKHRGFSYDDVTLALRGLDGSLAARVTIQNGLHVVVSQKVGDTKQGHMPAVFSFLKEVLAGWEGPIPACSFVLWVEDGMWEGSKIHSRNAPIFAFGRSVRDPYTMLMPDGGFLATAGYHKDLEDVEQAESTLSWEQKQATIFWRGATSGMALPSDHWQLGARSQLALACKRINDHSKLDAYFSLMALDKSSKGFLEIPEQGLLKEYLPFTEFLRYRHLVDVDGYCCAWVSLFLKLASRSTVLKVGSDYLQWYFDKLVPWVHYIPLLPDVSDIDWIIEWVNAHDDSCKEIAENGHALMKTITYQQAVIDMRQNIRELATAYRVTG
jgi:hypothetical protein